ncbi:hypothetical protein OG800_16060 [Streptomyces sp. NBC_00445]|uniref:hypothetical protein n=1 Tax=Streptomyces sp. NBC_00445 TaxID=2975745 RepID=UPI002E1A0C34
MTEPINSKYDTTPLPAPKEGEGGGEGDPGPEKDLSGLVPTTEVAWDTPPSFNIKPTDLSSGGGGDEPPDQEVTEPSGDLKIDLGAMRTAEQSILTETRGAVDKYEEVRTLVVSVQDTVFGQTAMDEYERQGDNTGSQGYNPQVGESYPNPFAETGQKFAAEMNPAMERALLHVGSTLEKLGEYVAMINHAGQVYAETDRQCRFPDPPAQK